VRPLNGVAWGWTRLRGPPRLRMWPSPRSTHPTHGSAGGTLPGRTAIDPGAALLGSGPTSTRPPSVTSATARTPIDDRPDPSFDDLDLDLARRIDEVCRRFEADWRQGRQPRIDDYLGDVSDEGRSALRAELRALERELRLLEETFARPEAGSPAAPEPKGAPN